MENITTNKHFNILAHWLFFCCASVFCMIIVGAITRLSDSGLSIVEWKPLIGAIPPLNEQEWHRVFDLYKASPEFQKENFWMELSDFKMIFFWEWFHRLLGRLIGVFYAIPFLFFIIKKWIPAGYKLKLLGIFFLGGAQGFMGWYMVKSGLVDIPAVSHYRLAAHLFLALLIYISMFWTGLTFQKKRCLTDPKPDTSLFWHGVLTLCLLGLTMLWGAFTAGLDAGLIYNNTFPKMGKTWLPEEIWIHSPLWINFFESHAGVQFIHRWLAIATALMVIGFCGHALAKKRREICIPLLGTMIVIQFGLGLATLFSVVYLPIATLHQGGAVITLTLLICAIHATKPR